METTAETGCMAKPGPSPSVTPEDVLEVFAARDDDSEPLTAPEVADALGCSRTTALERLRDLAEQGEVTSKKVGGRSRVWWVPSAEDGEHDVLAGYGSWTGTGLSEVVEKGREELDEDLREDGRALS
jgi:predicted ArsR family transcriptional regulator